MLHPEFLTTQFVALEVFVLAEDGYPPVDRDQVYEEIPVQAVQFKRHQVV